MQQEPPAGTTTERVADETAGSTAPSAMTAAPAAAAARVVSEAETRRYGPQGKPAWLR